MDKPSKNKKIASQVGLENLIKRPATQDSSVEPLSNDIQDTNPVQEGPKPKKVYAKPQTNISNSMFNLGKELDPSNPQVIALEAGFSTLPKTTASIAAYHLGGIANALGAVNKNANDSAIKPKKLNSLYDDKFARQEIDNYKERVKSNKGQKGDNWITRQINGLDVLVETGLKNAIDYAGIGVGHGLDLPDMLQKVGLPSVFDLNDLKLSTQDWMNQLDNFGKRQFNDLWVDKIKGMPNRAKKLNQQLDQDFRKKDLEIKLAKKQNTQKAEKALKDGTYDRASNEFYDSIGLGQINTGAKVLNSAAKWVDDKIFDDADSSESWLSKFSNQTLKADEEIRQQAQFELDREEKESKFKQASQAIQKKYGSDPDLYSKEMNKAYNQIYNKQRSQSILSEDWNKDNRNFFTKILDPNSYSGFEDIVDVDNKIMPMVGQAVGTLLAAEATMGGIKGVGSVAGAGVRTATNLASETKVARALSSAKPVEKFSELTSKFMQKPAVIKGYDLLKNGFKAAPFSFAMAYDESQQIGNQVYEKVVGDKLQKAVGLTKEEFYKKYAPEDGQNFSPAEIKGMDKDYEDQIIAPFMQNDPKAYKKIIDQANEASDLATTTNLLPETLGNMLMFKKFFGNSAITRSTKRFLPFLEKTAQTPVYKWAKQGLKTALTEGVLEEAGINMIAQRKGEYYADGKYYGVDDYIKEIGNQEWTDNMIAGILMGVPQNAAMSVSSGSLMHDVKTYREYKKVFNDYKELSKYTGRDELKNYLALNLDAANTKEFSRKELEYNTKLRDLTLELSKATTKEARKDIKAQIDNISQGFSQENNKFILTKINNAIQTGTVHNLVKTLENMSQEDNISEEDKSQLLDTVDSIKKLEGVYNQHIDKKDAGAIISNRFTDIVNRKQLSQINSQISTLEGTRDEALSRQARLLAEPRAISERKNKKLDTPKKGSFMYGKYPEIFNNALEEVKARYEEGDDLGEAGLRDLRNLEQDRYNIQSALDENQKRYNELISDEYQEKVDSRNAYYYDLSQLHDKDLTEDQFNTAKKKIVKKYNTILDRKDFDAIDNEVSVKQDNKDRLEKEYKAQIQKQKDIEEKAKLEVEAQKALEAQEKLEASKKDELAISEEEKAQLEQETPNRSVPASLESEESINDKEQEKVELATQETRTPEQESRLQEINTTTTRNERASQLDAILNPPQAELSSDENNMLQDLFGIDPSTVAGLPTFRSEVMNDTSLDVETQEEDEQYSPNILDDSKDYQNPIKNFVDDLITDIANRERISKDKVSAEDVLDELISVAGKDKAEKAFNIFEQGYKLNKPNVATDFGRLYDKYFTDRLTTLDNLLDNYTLPEEPSIEVPIENNQPVSQVAQPRFDENNKPIISAVQEDIPIEDMINEEQARAPQGRTSNPYVKKTNIFLGTDYLSGVLPALFDRALNFKSTSFQGLNIGELFNYKNYTKYGSNKLPMRLSLPENYRDILVKDEKDRFKLISFSEWETKYGYTRDSEEWINKVPILANFEGKPVFYLNDAEASYTMNIWENIPGETQDQINAKKEFFKELNNRLRKEVLNRGGSNIQVKTNLIDIINDVPPRLLKDFSKDILVGQWDPKTQVFKYKGNVIETTNKDFSYFNKDNNSPVILKPIGVNPRGEIQYQAFQVAVNGLLNNNHHVSLASAIQGYLSRNVRELNAPIMQNFLDKLKNEANIDVENYVDLNNYINSIYKTSYFADQARELGLTNEDDIRQAFSNFINNPDRNNALPGQASIAIVDFKVVLAVKPARSAANPLGNIQPEEIVVIDPANIKDANDIQYIRENMIKPLVRALGNSTSINISNNIRGNNKYFLMNAQDGSAIEYDSYDDYTRNFIEVPSSAMSGIVQNPDGSTQDIPTRYATLEITQDGANTQEQFQEYVEEKTEQVVQENRKEEAKEILPQASQEEINALVEKISKLEKSRERLVNNNVSTEAVDKKLAELRNELTQLDTTIDPNNYSVNIMSDSQVNDMISRERDMSNDIPGLSLYEQNDITLNIFNEISKSVGYQKGSKISKNKILSDIRNKVFGIVNQNIQNNVETIEDLESIDPEGLEETINELKEKNKVLESLKDHYPTLEAEVLTMLEEKTGIKEVKDKSRNTLNPNDDTQIDSQLESDASESEDNLSSDIDKDIIDRDKDFSTSSLEVKGKATVSAKMKRFLAGIPVLNTQGAVEKGFLGLPRYYDFRDLDNEIKVALNTPIEIDSDYDTVIAKLRSIQDQYSWAKPLADRLEDKNTPEQARIEFMYNYTGRHSISSKFIQFEEIKGRFYTELIDANFTDIIKNIRKDWVDNLKSDSIVYNATEDGDYVADPTTAKRLYKDFLDLGRQTMTSQTFKSTRNDLPGSINDINNIVNMLPGQSMTFNRAQFGDVAFNRLVNTVKNFPALLDVGQGVILQVDKGYDNSVTYSKPIVSDNMVTGLSDWLESIGISLNAATLTDIANNGLDLGKDGVLSFYSLLDPRNLKSPFSSIAKNLNTVGIKGDLGQSNSITDSTIFDGLSNGLLALARLESKHTNKVINKNFKDNGKLIQGLPIGKYATDRVKDLKDPQSGVLDNLSKISFSSNSLIGRLLMNDPEFNSRFQIVHTSNGSFKRKGGKFQDSAKVSDLTAMDLETAKLGYFFETKNVPNYNMNLLQDFSDPTATRIAQVFLPTMSDKDQMMSLQTVVFNINDFNNRDGRLSDPLLELLYSQLVKPDLERIANFHASGANTDIKNYDKAAQLFNLVSSMNTLTDENGDTITNLMKRDPSLYNAEYIEAKYKDMFKDELNNLVVHLTQEKLNKWKDLDIIDSKNNVKINQTYLDSRKDSKATRNINLATEFVFNNLLTNANAHMLIIGDPALYSQDKFFKKDKFEDGDPTRPLDMSSYRLWSESSLGTNLGKRLALMLAPGNKLYNSKNEIYHQIYLKDFVDISTNIVDLIGDFYSEEDKTIAQEMVNNIKEANKVLSTPESSKEQKDAARSTREESIKTLQNNYDKLADYLDIEATDAQEYTTIAEHINVMRRQGRIDDELFDNIQKKLQAQSEEAKKGLPISQANYLTKEEIGQVLQPIKPVHTGQIFDLDQDVARTVYVKSSSFPLIPQLTYGKPIDGVRRVLEEYEARVNQTAKSPVRVRASYDTANKVGATKYAISPFNLDGSFNETEFNIDNITRAKLELNRNNFRIQQDVPYKSDKGSEDRISYGTQMLKVLFSNGVLDVTSGFLNPAWNPEGVNEGVQKYISGRELFQKYNDAFVNLVQNKKIQLFRELGVNPQGFVENEEKFKQSIAKLLEKEGRKRDYSKNDLDAIKLNEAGEFVLPLFMNNQSSKIESLLISIITNRAVKHKFPGYSYVAGSEAGFRVLDNVEAVEGRDRIIYIEGFDGELKGTTNSKTDGGINFAEVMVPSKIRNNKGELLNLYEKNRNGEFIYLNVDPTTKRYKLKPEMVQKHLLNLVSFRIPTSSHVSLSNVKIVGILPPESGDLIIVPKNFTKQKGLDFDVDKENTYQLWTYINQNGQVKELSQSYINYQVNKLKNTDKRKLDNLVNEDSELYNELLGSLGTKDAVEEFISNTELTMDQKIQEFEDSMQQKLIENEIIKIHSSVLGNSNKEVKNKINKILSMDFAKEQAENIYALKELGKKNSFINANLTGNTTKKSLEEDYSKSNKHFTILSDDYQSYKMFLGSAGKSGIGVYSNYLTMSSLFQQYGNQGDFRLMEYDMHQEGFVPVRFSIANIGEVDGILGRIKTLDNSRSISEVFEELQNTATDNEKEQIMGRTGINTHTIGVFSIMSMLGIDKTQISKEIQEKYNLDITDDKMSFGNLLLSQNIVDDIVQKLEFNASNLTEFDNRQVIDIIRDLKNNIKTTRPIQDAVEAIYDEDGELIGVNSGDNFDLLTGDNLVSMIGSGDIQYADDFNYQVLSLLEKLFSFQDNFRNAQKILNISSNGLGLDLIENNNFNELLKKVVDNKVLRGIDKLLYKQVDNVSDLTPEERSKLVYINEFGAPLLPTTPIGASILNSFSMSKRLWGGFFPYQNKAYRDAVKNALENTSIKGNSASKINFERKFAKDFKKYLNSKNILFNGDVRSERERLFFDTPDNTSLANYIKTLLGPASEVQSVTARNIANNPLIKKLEFDINENNRKNTKNRFPSIIKYNDSNSIVENREVLYRAIPELIEMNAQLPTFNGVPYNTRLLAQDLVNYAYLEGGIQEIQQFVKYVPISYLEAMGFTKDMIERYNNYPNYLSQRDGTPSFTRQFFQHNPEYATRIKTFKNGLTYDAMKAKKLFNALTAQELILSDGEQRENGVLKNTFISIHDPEAKGNKYILFERDPSNENRFVKRNSVGYFGLAEYDSTKKISTSLKNSSVEIPGKPNTATVIDTSNTDMTVQDFGIGESPTQQVVDKMLELDNQYTKVFEPFRNYVPEGLVIEVDQTKGTGRYNRAQNTITINPDTVSRGSEFLSRILVKELMHAMTANYVSNYLNDKGAYLDPNTSQQVPLPVRKLKVLYGELLNSGATLKNSQGVSLEDFVQNYQKGSAVSREDFNKFYGFTDIHEFMEMAMTEPEFRKFLDDISSREARATGQSFLDRLKSIFKDIWSNITNRQVSRETVDTISDIIFSTRDDVGPNSPTNENSTDNFSPVEDALAKTRNLLSSDLSSKFAEIKEEDPFRCRL